MALMSVNRLQTLERRQRGTSMRIDSGARTGDGPGRPVTRFLYGWKTGAGEGIRTLDPNLGKVVLYP